MRKMLARSLSRRSTVFVLALVCCAMLLFKYSYRSQDSLPNADGPLPGDSYRRRDRPVRDYDRGFANGYQAYREQSGEYIPSEQYSTGVVAHRYSKFHWSDAEARGYVDGYHKATEMQFCPAETY